MIVTVTHINPSLFDFKVGQWVGFGRLAPESFSCVGQVSLVDPRHFEVRPIGSPTGGPCPAAKWVHAMQKAEANPEWKRRLGARWGKLDDKFWSYPWYVFIMECPERERRSE